MENKEKKQWSNRRRFLVFTGIFFILLFLVSEVMTIADPVSLANIKGFYKEEKHSIDVAFIGPSEFYADYSPTLAWDKFGYTSYALAGGGFSGSLYKSMLKEYLKYQSPNLVVFEINGFLQDDDYYQKPAKLHTWIDSIPWSKNKIETIREIVPKEEQYSYYFKLASNHNSWKNPRRWGGDKMARLDIAFKKYANGKGFSTYAKARDMSKGKTYQPQLTQKGQGYLEDLLKYCNQQGVENVLFVRFPHGGKIGKMQVIDKIQNIVESYGYDFLNLNSSYREIGIDPKKDFYDKEHLNVYGMEKLTDYFGKYLIDHYPIQGEHTEEQIKRWNQCAQKTRDVIERCKIDIEKDKNTHYWEVFLH